MKIVAISDLHGQFPVINEDNFDVLCVCGDIMPLKAQTNMPQCKSWLKKRFIPWCDSLPCTTVLLIAGNHDFYFERTPYNDILDVFVGSKVKYVDSEVVEVGGKKFYGAPYCHRFGNWAFMREDDTLKILFEDIPENVDVLLTHDAPYGTSDICLQDTIWYTGEHIGCKPLRDAVIDKHPKVLLHGHLHSTNHNVELLQDTEVYNVSVLDEDYKLTYKPLVIEI